MNEAVAERIENIALTFRSGQAIAQEEKEFDAIVARLNDLELDFRAVGYEGAAMALVMTRGTSITKYEKWWDPTLSPVPNYRDHLLMGYGWAMAATQLDVDRLNGEFQPMDRARILDGFGYYHGLFRKRQAVIGAQVPENLTSEQLHLFDRGLGRALWYIAKGDIQVALTLAGRFDESRQEALWTGIGLACTFVGGSSIEDLQNILEHISGRAIAFKTGIVLAYLARITTNSVDPFATAYCEHILEGSKDQVLNAIASANYDDQSQIVHAIKQHLS